MPLDLWQSSNGWNRIGLPIALGIHVGAISFTLWAFVHYGVASAPMILAPLSVYGLSFAFHFTKRAFRHLRGAKSPTGA